MDIPNHNQMYEGPDRDPPLWARFDQFTKEMHEEQPVTVQEVLEMVQNLLYRLRWSLTFTELVVEIRELLRHNEHHITHDEALLTTPDGEAVPFITPEVRQQNPDRAAMADELLAILMKQVEITPEDFTK